MVKATNGATPTIEKRRGRGVAKSFPLTSFEDALVLPRAIHEHGVDGELRRITVFDRMGRSPESGPGRQLVTDSAKYGLTSGSYGAEYLRLTENGSRLVDADAEPQARRRVEFDLAVQQIKPFNQLYERLRSKRVPAADVMKDQLTSIPETDRDQCTRIFLENARYLGLIQKQAGADRIITVDEALEAVPATQPERKREPRAARRSEDEARPPPTRMMSEPKVHIDINIHIDQSATPEQIEQIFASMARHLYPTQT